MDKGVRSRHVAVELEVIKKQARVETGTLYKRYFIPVRPSSRCRHRQSAEFVCPRSPSSLSPLFDLTFHVLSKHWFLIRFFAEACLSARSLGGSQVSTLFVSFSSVFFLVLAIRRTASLRDAKISFLCSWVVRISCRVCWLRARRFCVSGLLTVFQIQCLLAFPSAH